MKYSNCIIYDIEGKCYYLINDGKEIKLRGKNEKIMQTITKKLNYKQKDNYKIYTNFTLIMFLYMKEILKNNSQKFLEEKKINTKNILFRIAFITVLSTIGIIGSNITKLKDDTSIKTTQENNTTKNSDTTITTENTATNTTNESINTETKDNEPIKKTDEIIINKNNVYHFKYEFKDIGDKEDLIAAKKYIDIFQKYEEIYGIDDKLLMLIAAQESSGIHSSESKNGHATGLMGIEKVWDNEEMLLFTA